MSIDGLNRPKLLDRFPVRQLERYEPKRGHLQGEFASFVRQKTSLYDALWVASQFQLAEEELPLRSSMNLTFTISLYSKKLGVYDGMFCRDRTFGLPR